MNSNSYESLFFFLGRSTTLSPSLLGKKALSEVVVRISTSRNILKNFFKQRNRNFLAYFFLAALSLNTADFNKHSRTRNGEGRAAPIVGQN